MFQTLTMTAKKSCWDPMRFSTVILFATSYAFLLVPSIFGQVNGPKTCEQPLNSCTAYLYYPLAEGEQMDDIAKLFHVQKEDIMERNTTFQIQRAVLVGVTCTCSDDSHYSAATQYTVTSENPNELDIVQKVYKDLAYETGQSAGVGKLLSISLFCGCIDRASQHLVSYVWQTRDNFEGVKAKFNANGTDLMVLNNLTDTEIMFPSDVVFYIPMFESDWRPVNSRTQTSGTENTEGGNIPLGAIVGIVLASLLVVAAIAALVFFLQKRRMWCYAPRSKVPPFRNRAFVSQDMPQDWNFFGCFRKPNVPQLRNPNENVKRQISLSKEMMNGVFGMEKPIIFPYLEILHATDNFKEKNHLGAGAYGSVYQGKLREQDVAIKRMKATKRKEFFAELKVLCKVHHTNLVELIGYSVGEEELFLVYEFAENRAVSDRLHDPLSKEYAPLSWNARLQIALDAARGLEYIHEHTKAHYVHRDVKTSNILLDGCFRAKVADFGLAKLVEATDTEATTTGVVGTSGYLAPEYLRDGQATAKSDVYAFGVVLFELITGEEAFSKSRNGNVPSDKRSLISVMLNALGDGSAYSISKLKSCIDPLLQDMYPLDCIHRMATLGRQCVEEDPAVRPDMNHVVFTLSQLLLNSIEWEATLAGNSQIFSGLVIGR